MIQAYTKRNITLITVSILYFVTSLPCLAQFYPPNNEKLLFIGQDLASVEGYLNNCTGCHKGHGETTYLSFYNIETASITIDATRSMSYGAMGMDNSGNQVTTTTDWGAGPLNLWTVTERSTLINIGMSIVEDRYAGLDGLQRIINGDHDSKIIKIATFFNMFPSKIFYLRIGYEFDGQWNSYDTTKYKAAYQHIVDILNANLNQDNVDYVWQSSTSPVDDILDGRREVLDPYYPGDDYVDWMGLSWFLRANEEPTLNTSHDPATQLELANELVAFAQSKGKPVMIAEASPQGYQIDAKNNCNISPVYDGKAAEGCVSKTATQIYTEWFDELFSFMTANDDVRALSYINADWDAQYLWSSSNEEYGSGYWGDTRVEADNDIMTSWKASISDSSNKILQTEDGSTILNVLSVNDHSEIRQEKISLYPNPTSGRLYIKGAENTKLHYEVLTVTGRKIFEGNGLKVNFEKMPAGVYFIKLAGHSLKRVIKQ